MFILILVILSFSHSYMVLLRNNIGKIDYESLPSEATNLQQYDLKWWPYLTSSYLLAFGEFGISDHFGETKTNLAISWTFFILSTLIINIILMNLLISIVSETFATFKENYNQYMYYDMLSLIIENRYLLIG